MSACWILQTQYIFGEFDTDATPKVESPLNLAADFCRVNLNGLSLLEKYRTENQEASVTLHKAQRSGKHANPCNIATSLSVETQKLKCLKEVGLRKERSLYRKDTSFATIITLTHLSLLL